MSEKPILFNTEMVKAIMEGRKTVTRRVIKRTNGKDFIGYVTCSVPKGDEGKAAFGRGSLEDIVNANIDEYIRPPYKVGDILYVRETWAICHALTLCSPNRCSIEHQLKENLVWYRADGEQPNEGKTAGEHLIGRGKWRPSIHMPKEAARIFLRVTNVRVERLQEITTEQILKEGVIQRFDNVNDRFTPDILRGGFIELWNSTIKKEDIEIYSYKSNPWVWVIEFERIEKECK